MVKATSAGRQEAVSFLCYTTIVTRHLSLKAKQKQNYFIPFCLAFPSLFPLCLHNNVIKLAYTLCPTHFTIARRCSAKCLQAFCSYLHYYTTNKVRAVSHKTAELACNISLLNCHVVLRILILGFGMNLSRAQHGRKRRSTTSGLNKETFVRHVGV